jgi:hypothetical protein
VKSIVGEKHRRSYDNAARLLAACAEVLRLRDKPEAARALLDDVRQHFPGTEPSWRILMRRPGGRAAACNPTNDPKALPSAGRRYN